MDECKKRRGKDRYMLLIATREIQLYLVRQCLQNGIMRADGEEWTILIHLYCEFCNGASRAYITNLCFFIVRLLRL